MNCLPVAAGPAQRGFTLIEILVATALVLLLMGIVVTIFADVGKNIRNSRSALEKNDQLRAALHRLRKDLEGATAGMRPPLNPDANLGYMEIIEGPMGVVYFPNVVAPSNPTTGLTDNSTQADSDDIVMLTTRSKTEPFTGRFSYLDSPQGSDPPDGSDSIGSYKWYTTTIQSDTAEVAWFVRGTTLYRRVLLVRPDRLTDTDVRAVSSTLNPVDPLPVRSGFYGGGDDPSYVGPDGYDLSVRVVGGDYDRDPGQTTQDPQIVPNTLGDLTKRENRFAHQPHCYPHDARGWGALGLPTLRECSDPSWPFPLTLPDGGASGAGSTDGSASKFQRHASHVYGSADPKSFTIFPRGGGTNPVLLAEEDNSRLLRLSNVQQPWQSHPGMLGRFCCPDTAIYSARLLRPLAVTLSLDPDRPDHRQPAGISRRLADRRGHDSHQRPGL